MTEHRVGTREEWLAARTDLLEAEKDLTRRGDELARRRRELPWVRIEKDYRFRTEDGEALLRDLFGGRSQLIVQHIMFPGCPSCSSVADGYDGFVVHLENNDVAFVGVSRYPIEELTAFGERMGWSFRWVSSLGSDFNFDFGVAYTDEMIAGGDARHNMHLDWDHSGTPDEPFGKWEERPPKDLPGMSAFALEDGVVYHTYSAYARGTDALWGMWQYLDRAPKGRNEGSVRLRLRDEYRGAAGAAG
ncbi:MAG: DUF899 domain-containing protein [Actinomycetota bacterium]|nr:DUF899 domain-containing protein [Actinomycetota bacterium]